MQITKLKEQRRRDYTIFVPSLYGQHKILKNDIIPIFPSVSRVIQMGNLLGLSDSDEEQRQRYMPDNAECVRWLYEAYHKNQKFEFLIGSNEMVLLNAPKLLESNSGATLRSMWFVGDNPRMKVATVSKNRLVTACGLTSGLWERLGCPQTAYQAATAINTLYYRVMYPGECLSLGDAPSFSASPITANFFLEFIPSWVTYDRACPFDQVISSASFNTPIGREYLNDARHYAHYVEKVKIQPTGSTCYIKGAKVTSVYVGIPFESIPHIPEPWRLLVERSSPYS